MEKKPHARDPGLNSWKGEEEGTSLIMNSPYDSLTRRGSVDGTKSKGKGRLNTVKSGIALSELVNSPGERADSQVLLEKSLQSRTGRVLLAGAGFLADAYDLFVINLVLRLLRDEYPQNSATDDGIRQLQLQEGMVASAALVGSIIGQLTAGVSADIIGRKVIFIATAVLITIGALGSASSGNHNIYGQIACWRFILGLGVGGEYPLAATVTSESSSAGSRGKLMSAVFAMQGVGSILSTVVVMLCLSWGCSAAFTWRFALAFGSVPVLLALPWRWRMHETDSFERIKRERQDVRNDDGSIPTEAEHVLGGGRLGELRRGFRLYKYHLLGTSLCWFLLDVDFYANGLFNHEITSLVLSNGKSTALDDARNSALLALIGLPGFFITYTFIDTVGRKNIQLLGFAVMSVLFLTLWAGHAWFTEGEVPLGRKYLYLLLYALTFLFSNFGPNSTTFIIPGGTYMRCDLALSCLALPLSFVFLTLTLTHSSLFSRATSSLIAITTPHHTTPRDA
jgi:PHS family inorganic phosphate transporter-like MFS transporter